MILRALLTVTLLLLQPAQDTIVITYSRGTIDTKSYEAFTFWIRDNKRAYIRYTLGKDDEINLIWQGTSLVKGEQAFIAVFPEPDNRSFYIMQNGNGLKVSDKDGKYLKFYSWENENLVGDSAVPCPICAKDAKEGAELIKKYFLK